VPVFIRGGLARHAAAVKDDDGHDLVVAQEVDMVHEVADVAPGAGALGVHAQLHAAGVGPFVEPRVGVDADLPERWTDSSKEETWQELQAQGEVLGICSIYPLAGVLLDVHGLDEWLHEPEKVGDSHQCGAPPQTSWFRGGLDWEVGIRKRAGR
jgi:hypothetical protein